MDGNKGTKLINSSMDCYHLKCNNCGCDELLSVDIEDTKPNPIIRRL